MQEKEFKLNDWKRHEKVVGVKIIPRNNELFIKALKRFKKLCEREGIMRDLRRHEFYETRSQKRRRKTKAAIKQLEKENNPSLNKKFQPPSTLIQPSDIFDFYIQGQD